MKSMTLWGRMAGSAVILFTLVAGSYAQISWTKGQVWVGKHGITETVAQIMRRPTEPPPGIHETKKTELDSYTRVGMLPNPGSPDISRFPIDGGFSGTNVGGSVNGGGVTLSGPLFSTGTTWLAGTVGESGFIPPDTMGDASPTQVMWTANGRFKIFDRLGNLGALNTTSDSFWQSVRSSGTSDPRVRYDRLTNRWIVVMIDVANSNNRCMIAVSNSGTITNTSSFTFFFFNYATPLPTGDASGFFDYPTIGIDANSIIIGGNIFFSNRRQTDVFVVNKSKLINNNTLSVAAFRSMGNTQGTQGFWTPHGIDNDNPNATESYVLGADILFYGILDLRRITYDVNGVPSISSNISISTPSTSGPRAVPAQGSSFPLDALDHRLFAAKMFTNRLTGVATIWTAADYGTNSTGIATGSPDRTGSRWYEISGYQTGQTPTLLQVGSLFDSAGSNPKNYWIPSIAENGQGYALLGCSSAGTTAFANSTFAQRAPGDPLGTLQTPINITNTGSSYNIQTGGTQRWGDYSHTSVDPADGMSLWTYQEFCNANNSWGVEITHLLSVAPTVTGAVPNNANQGATLDVVVSGTGLFDGGPSFPNRLRAQVSGTGVTVNTVTFNNQLQATVNLTIANNAPTGARTLTMTNPDGQSAGTTFTVNAASAVGSGTVTLGQWTATEAGVPVTFQIYDLSNTLQQTAVANLDASGNYSFTVTVAPGTYTVMAKASHWLRRAVHNVVITTGGFSGVNFSLINGDINGDNVISLADFGALKAAFGSMPGGGNWNPNADLNGDGVVSLADFGILKSNFGQSGD